MDLRTICEEFQRKVEEGYLIEYLDEDLNIQTGQVKYASRNPHWDRKDEIEGRSRDWYVSIWDGNDRTTNAIKLGTSGDPAYTWIAYSDELREPPSLKDMINEYGMDKSGVIGKISVNPPEGFTEDSFSQDNSPELINLATLYKGLHVKAFIVPQSIEGLETSANLVIKRIALLHQNYGDDYFNAKLNEFIYEKGQLEGHFEKIICHFKEQCVQNMENKEVYDDILTIIEANQVKAMEIIKTMQQKVESRIGLDSKVQHLETKLYTQEKIHNADKILSNLRDEKYTKLKEKLENELKVANKSNEDLVERIKESNQKLTSAITTIRNQKNQLDELRSEPAGNITAEELKNLRAAVRNAESNLKETIIEKEAIRNELINKKREYEANIQETNKANETQIRELEMKIQEQEATKDIASLDQQLKTADEKIAASYKEIKLSEKERELNTANEKLKAELKI